jgi:hypothetical protein
VVVGVDGFDRGCSRGDYLGDEMTEAEERKAFEATLYAASSPQEQT